jgi:protein-tyrosine kinase
MSLVEQALKKVQQARVRPAGVLESAEAEPAALEGRAGSPGAGGQISGETAPPERILTMDRKMLRLSGLLPPEEQERQIAHEYRQIKRPLIDNAFGRGRPAVESGRLVMVASAMPGDGKTFTSINLALSIAREKDVSVLLVDADVAKPHISRLLGVEHEKGLLDALRDPSIQIEDLILATDARGMSFLPAGAPAENATELLASDRMQQVMRRIVALNPNRMVLFDSPPLLVTSESRVVATIAGQVVLVVCAERTPQKAVFASLDILGQGKSVGIVLNQGGESSGSYGYGYYGQGSEADPSAG